MAAALRVKAAMESAGFQASIEEPPPPGDEDAPPEAWRGGEDVTPLLNTYVETSPPKAATKAPAPRRAASSSRPLVAPFGKNKGKTPAELDDKDLAYFAGKAQESLANESNARFHPHESLWLAALESEMAKRGSGPVIPF